MKMNFIRKWYGSLPLSIKLTIYFVIFGMMIGYLTLISFTMISSRSFLNFTGSFMESQFQNIMSEQGPDVLLNMAKAHDPMLFRAAKTLQKDSIHSISTFMLYYQEKQSGAWKQINIDPRQKEISYLTVEDEDIRYIERMDRRKILSKTRFFFGGHDTLHVFINLTRSVDENRYVLHVESNREGLVTLMRNNIRHVVVFEIILFLVSLLLGKFFARKVVKPVTRLSSVAEEIAGGNYSMRFAARTNDEIGSLAHSLNTMASETEKHIADIHHRMKAMETMNQIDKAVLSSISRKDLLERVVGYVSSMYDNIYVVLSLWVCERSGFILLTSTGDDMKRMLKDDPFIPLSAFTPEVSDRKEEIFQLTSRENREIAEKNFGQFPGGGKGSIVNIPIFTREQYMGSLIIHKDEDSGFNPDIISALAMLADQMGVALSSVQAFDEKEQLLLGIMMALTKSIDAKSRWTAGHSERVASYAQELAIAAGLSTQQVRELSISSLLHDIGKIGVPESVLDKPGRLDDNEYTLIKTHPEKGAEILKDIPSYGTIVNGVLHHHEHWNGKGYPHGLGEQDIPLQARIMTLSDVFEAITDDRPYRKGLTLEEALNFLRKYQGEMFDPELTDLFIELLSTSDLYSRVSQKQV